MKQSLQSKTHPSRRKRVRVHQERAGGVVLHARTTLGISSSTVVVSGPYISLPPFPLSHSFNLSSLFAPEKCKKTVQDTIFLHHETATAGLLWCVRVLAPRDGAPRRRHHVVSCAVAVGNNAVAASQRRMPFNNLMMGLGLPLGSSADRDTFALKVLTQAVVQLCQTPQLEVGHRLPGLLDLRRVADIAGCVLRHLGGRSAGVERDVVAGVSG